MGKKDKEKMAKERSNFIEGCARTNNIPEKKANSIFDLLEKFAGYGFNKSHAAAYALVAYQTAYMKANYPVEFMAGLLSNEINNTDKISTFVGECKRMGIPILPPDVNRSGLKFLPEITEASSSGQANAIRYGLAAIKNVGQGAMELAIQEREAGGEYTSLEDFCRRLDSRIANRKILENLVKCGAFDFLGRERAELFACIEDSLAAASESQKDRASGQVSLFDEMPPPKSKPNSIITGTGPFAFAGVVSVRSISTLIDGYAVLSTCPTSFLVTTDTSPFISSVVETTSHFTDGVCAGMRP